MSLTLATPPDRLQTVIFDRQHGQAAANFFLNARSLGTSVNGVTAAAAIPRIFYTGPGTPLLDVKYPIRSASSYDWSSLPTLTATNSHAEWTVGVTNVSVSGIKAKATPGQVAVGINHAIQAKNDHRTFFAGALLGIAGGALVAGFQELLHVGD